jgi:hypothetical protein
MAKHLLMNILAAGGLTVAFAAGAAGDACAFTETAVPAPAAQVAPAKDAPAAQLQMQKPEEGKGLALTVPGDAKSNGTEVKVPGIGTVGVLPKLDFGLELLYGASGNSAQEPAPENKNDDVQIKGSIKHRF